MSRSKKSFIASGMQLFVTGGNFLFGMLMAAYFGSTPEMDSYVVVMNFTALVGGVLAILHSKSLIPYLGGVADPLQQQEDFRSIARFNTVVLFFLSLLLFFFSGGVVHLLAPGLDTGSYYLAQKMMKIASLFLFLINGISLAKAHVEFMQRPYLSQFIEIGRVTLLLLLFGSGVSFFSLGILVLPLANTLALLILTLILFIFYSRSPFTLFAKGPFISPAVKGYLVLAAPILVGQLLVWAIRLSDTILASFLSEGTLSQLSYSLRLVNNFSVIFTGLSIVYMPILARLQHKESNEEHAQVALEGFSHLFFIALALAGFTLVFAPLIIALLFQRGSFTHNDTIQVAYLLRGYGYMFFGAPLGGYLAGVYYARKAAKRATIYSVISSVTNLVLNFVLVYYFKAIGLAIASSIAFFVGNVLLLTQLKTINPSIKLSQFSTMMFRSIVVVVVALWGTLLFQGVFNSFLSVHLLGTLTILFIVYALELLLIGEMMKISTITIFVSKVRKIITG